VSIKTDFVFCKTDVQAATQTVAKKLGLLSLGLVLVFGLCLLLFGLGLLSLTFLALPLVLVFGFGV
jgi:hypothetical protein